jgi:hypothetical protein
MTRCALALLAVACVACGPDDRDPASSDAAVDAAVDSPPPAIDAPPARCYDEALVVNVELQIQIEQSCAIWNSLAALAGHATVTRAGMMLTIDFGDGVVFTGTVVNGMVNLVYAHDHPFSDGCGWRATETLAGHLDPTSCNLTRRYDYVESVVIDNGGCATSCSARADVDLQLTPIP